MADRNELIAKFRSEFPADKEIHLDLGGTIIKVLCNTDELVADLNDYFKEFAAAAPGEDIVITAHEAPTPDFDLEFNVKKPDPGKTKIKEEWVDLPDGRIVRKRLTGMHFIFGEGENLAIGPCLENSNQVINFINNRFIEMKLNQGCLLGHAAGVQQGDRALSLAGFSGAGKSTLALHCMSKGTLFVSNDRVMVEDNDNDLTMYGVAKQPRINPGTALNNPDLCRIIAEEDREQFLALPKEELWNLEHKYDALIDECYGAGKFLLAAPMTGLVILNWKRNDEPLEIKRVDPFERKELLPAFMKGTGLFYLPVDKNYEDPNADVYAEALRKCVLIEMSGGIDFDKAADACIHFMETGKLPGE